MPWTCPECRLPDPHHGDGDGIDTCNCPRCPCGDWPAEHCDCADDDNRTRDADWDLEVTP